MPHVLPIFGVLMARQRIIEHTKAAAAKAATQKARTRGRPAAKPKRTSRAATNPYGSDTSEITDDFFSKMVAANVQMTGDPRVYTTDEAERWISVIPFPSLCLEYMFAQNGYPLSRMMHLFGIQHSGKSAMAVEIMRWHLEQGGMAAISETEGKDIPDLRNSLLGNPEFRKRVFFNQDPGTDLWQRRVTYWLKSYKKAADGAREGTPGLGRKTVFNMIVDSVGAAATEEERKKIGEAGFAGRGHPVTALAISSFMKTLPDQLIEYPINLTFVNHMKPGQDAAGRPTSSTYGGKSVKFHTTYELEMARIKSIKQARSGGIDVSFQLRKNGLGELGRKISAKLVWGNRRTTDNELQQFSYWDWHGATIDMLLKQGTDTASIRKEIAEVVDLRPVSGRRMYSKALGVPKDAPLRYEQLGELLHTRHEIIDELRKILGIHVRPTFEPGIDLRQQQDEFEKYRKNRRVCPVLKISGEATNLIDGLAELQDNTQHVDGRTSDLDPVETHDDD